MDSDFDGSTIAEAIEIGFRVTAVCIPCNHHRDLDLKVLEHDLPVRQIARRLRCSKCRRLGRDVLVRPPGCTA